jgi:hypothetical protein
MATHDLVEIKIILQIYSSFYSLSVPDIPGKSILMIIPKGCQYIRAKTMIPEQNPERVTENLHYVFSYPSDKNTHSSAIYKITRSSLL